MNNNWGIIVLRVIFLLAIVCGLTAIPAFSQGTSAECLQQVRNLYKKLGDPPPAGKTYALSYTLHMRAKVRGKTENISSKVRLLMSRDRMHMMTDEVEVYQDKGVAFTLLPGNKELYVHDGAADSGRDLRKKMFGAFQDSIFSSCIVTKCHEIKGGDGRQKRRVVLQMHEKVRKAYSISSVIIDIDMKHQSIDQVEYNFTPEGKYEWMKMVVDKADYDHKTDAFSTPLGTMFFDSKGKLLPKYRSYSFTDNRNRQGR